MYKYKISITLKQFCFPFKPEVTRYEFEVEAETELQAITKASEKVKSRGYPYDEKQVRVLYSNPVVNEEKLVNADTDTWHLTFTEPSARAARRD